MRGTSLALHGDRMRFLVIGPTLALAQLITGLAAQGHQYRGPGDLEPLPGDRALAGGPMPRPPGPGGLAPPGGI